MIDFWANGDGSYLKEMNLKERLVMGMISGLIDKYFAAEVINIIVASYSRFTKEATPEDKSRVDSFLAQQESGFHSYWSLRMIYETEFDDVEKADKIAKDKAKEIASNLVTKYGWRKEKVLTLKDYKGVDKSFDIGKMSDIKNITINVLAGDEVATVIYNDGNEKRFDASDDRNIDYEDGQYTLYDKETDVNFLESQMFLSRKDAYDFMYMASELQTL